MAAANVPELTNRLARALDGERPADILSLLVTLYDSPASPGVEKFIGTGSGQVEAAFWSRAGE